MSPDADERLRAATQALRETREASTEELEATERRLLATLAEGRGPGPSTLLRRRPRSWAAASLATLALGSAGLAAVRGGAVDVPQWLGQLLDAPPRHAAPSRPSAGADAARAPTPSPTPTPAPPAETPSPAPADEVAPAPPTRRLPVPVARPTREAPPAREAPSAPAGTASEVAASEVAEPAPPAPRADEVYALGHRAHFVERDPRAALEAWDAYLALAPLGRYAPEARFNRALDLVRLGRTGEASDALEVLARGEYRAADAARLLVALNPGAGRVDAGVH